MRLARVAIEFLNASATLPQVPPHNNEFAPQTLVKIKLQPVGLAKQNVGECNFSGFMSVKYRHKLFIAHLSSPQLSPQ
jgi:hypothetical protein